MLVLLAGTIAFSAGKMLYGDKVMGKISVGVVLPEDDKLAKMAVSMIASLDSVGSLCEFQYLDENEGEELLKAGKIFALMEVPEGLVQGIMDGSNIPVNVVFPRSAGLEASVFKELTEAGTSILGTAQAGIYAADEFLRIHKMESSVAQAEKDLNQIFMKYALSRSDYFRERKVSASGDVSVAVFYGISAAVFVFLLCGIPAAPMVKPYGRVMEQKLFMLGIGRWKRTAVRTVSLFLPMAVISALPYLWCVTKGYLSFHGAGILMWLLICLASSGWILFVYELCSSETAGILLLFFSTVVMMFLSGGIVPAVFLPEAFGNIGKWMPTAFLAEGVKWMFTGGTMMPAVKLLSMEAVVFCLSAAVRRNYE